MHNIRSTILTCTLFLQTHVKHNYDTSYKYISLKRKQTILYHRWWSRKSKCFFCFISFFLHFTSNFTNCRFSLLEQLQLCIATTSVCNLFAKPPNSFFTFCPALASRYARSVRSDGATGGRGTVTPFDTSGDKRKNGCGGGDNNNWALNPLHCLIFCIILMKLILWDLWKCENVFYNRPLGVL